MEGIGEPKLVPKPICSIMPQDISGQKFLFKEHNNFLKKGQHHFREKGRRGKKLVIRSILEHALKS